MYRWLGNRIPSNGNLRCAEGEGEDVVDDGNLPSSRGHVLGDN